MVLEVQVGFQSQGGAGLALSWAVPLTVPPPLPPDCPALRTPERRAARWLTHCLGGIRAGTSSFDHPWKRETLAGLSIGQFFFYYLAC